MISLDDLVNITVELIETTPEQKYIVAVDDSKHTLGEVLKAIADNLGTGIVKHQPQENVFLQRDISQENADMATLDLKIDAGHVKEMTFEWKYEAGIVENMPQIVQEYKDCRGLWPLKIMIHGPPASRKTHYAEKIASHYKIKLVDADQVMKDTIDKLERKLAQKSDAEDADAEELESARETLNELKETLQSGQKFTSEQLTRHVHEKLKSTSCRNQGYILDGFPATTQDATALFKRIK